MEIRSRIFHFLLFGVICISGYIRFSQIKNYDFPFTYDQARDMLDIRVLGNFVDFAVSGPTTSITGLNLGPYYYLWNLPAYWYGSGDPQYLNYWNIIWFLLTSIIVYLFFYKKDRQLLGFFIATIFLMAPQLFPITRYFWNAHAVVYIIVFYFLAFWNYIEKRDIKSTIVWGITAGLVIQFEAAFGSMALAFAFLYVLTSRSWKKIGVFIFAATPWFLPQGVYEIKNNFQMTKRFMGFISGANPIVGEKLQLNEVIILHWNTFLNFFEGQLMLPYGIGAFLLCLSILICLINKIYRKMVVNFLVFIFLALLFYVIVYPHELKPWYLEGIRVWYIFVLSMGLVAFIQFMNKREDVIASITKYAWQTLAIISISIFLVRSFFLTIIDQNSYIIDNGKSNDPKNAKNIMTSIDWVYEKANGDGFEAYNYVPEVYDFSSQYMYSWHGNRKYGYIPKKTSYSLEGVPEYIRSESAFLKNQKENSNDQVALIYETIGNYEEWLKQFDKYCVIATKETGYNTKLEWREKCE